MNNLDPAEIIINEAIEMTKEFSDLDDEKQHKFNNSLIDNIYKKIKVGHMNEQRYLTVSALTEYIKIKIENDNHLKRVFLKGEISNFTHHGTGHLYFSLKDEDATISAMMFKTYASTLNFKPKAGDKVLVEGYISVYKARGTYSISIFFYDLRWGRRTFFKV